jgi:hypothetical protein
MGILSQDTRILADIRPGQLCVRASVYGGEAPIFAALLRYFVELQDALAGNTVMGRRGSFL